MLAMFRSRLLSLAAALVVLLAALLMCQPTSAKPIGLVSVAAVDMHGSSPRSNFIWGGRPASTRNQSGSDTRSDAGTSARTVPTQPRTHRAAEQPADGEFPASVCTADDILLSQVPVALVMQRAPVALDPEVASDGAGATTVGVTVTLPAIPIPIPW